MKYVLISLVVGFAVACGGGGGGGGGQTATTTNTIPNKVEDQYSLTALGKGKSVNLYPDTKIVIRSLDEFKVYYKLFTGYDINEQYYNMSKYDILLIVHNQTVDDYFLNVNNITTTGGNLNLNVYYYITGVDVPGMYNTYDGINTIYQFYTVPKTTGKPTFTKIVP